jgi:tetratricopeptide (TPR) repeat protein
MLTNRRLFISITAGVVATIVGVGAYLKISHQFQKRDGATKSESTTLTPADLRIQKAQAMIQHSSQNPDGYNLLAAAYMQKARETADHGFNARAEAALARSFEIDRDNYDALKLQAKLLLSNHRFSEALESCKRAQTVRHDDADVFGAMTDANVELGNYPEAVQAAQKMVDLRPDTSAYSRIAYLRSLHGDNRGAINAMKVAVRAADPGDPEAMAWCRVQLGNELMNIGKREEAENEYTQALRIFPIHRAAIEAKARARVAAGDMNGAIALYNQAQATGPSADPALAMGDLYMCLGRDDEAKRQYELFESLEKENVKVENSWRHLIYYWLDHDKNVEEALGHAQEERQQRRDIFTCDLLAWALFKNGKLSEARTAVAEALRLGTKDARIDYHAGMIDVHLGSIESGIRYLERALRGNGLDALQTKAAQKTLEGLRTK